MVIDTRVKCCTLPRRYACKCQQREHASMVLFCDAHHGMCCHNTRAGTDPFEASFSASSEQTHKCGSCLLQGRKAVQHAFPDTTCDLLQPTQVVLKVQVATGASGAHDERVQRSYRPDDQSCCLVTCMFPYERSYNKDDRCSGANRSPSCTHASVQMHASVQHAETIQAMRRITFGDNQAEGKYGLG